MQQNRGFLALSRRSVLMAGGAAAALAACRRKPGRADIERQIRYQIDQLVAGGEVPAAGLIVRRQGDTVFSHAAGAAGGLETGRARPFTVGTLFRAASMSKMVTALAARDMAASGMIDLDEDVSRWFEKPFRHPQFPDTPISLRDLLSHLAGLEDPDVYWMPIPGKIEDLFTDDMWRTVEYGPPGKGFRYANFGYGIAATIMERASGLSFERLSREHVLDRLELSAGFNWVGVPPRARQDGATIYRKTVEGWRVEADGADILASNEPAVPLSEGASLDDFKAGVNGTVFSPQGGLRASLSDLAVIVRAAAMAPGAGTPDWTYDPSTNNGETEGGFFGAYGMGLQSHAPDASPIPGKAMTGHYGEAYGLYGGAFRIAADDAEIAFVVTGSPDAGIETSTLHPCANIYTAPLFMAAAQVLTLS